MKTPSLPGNDARSRVYSLDLNRGSRHLVFDRIARITTRTFHVPIALVTLLDDDEQWFCAAVGTDVTGNRRDESFCNHTIDELRQVLVVPDALENPRFAGLPMVTGGPQIRFYAGATLATSDGHSIGTLCIVDVTPRTMSADDQLVLRDLADVIESELEHRTLALTDPLTHLPNRRAFMSAAENFVALGVRRDEPVTLLFIDVDGLKHVNDNVGHLAGDALLRRAADCLGRATRRSDVAARIGGDEFAVLLYNVGVEGAQTVVQSILTAVEVNNSNSPDDVPLSLAVGMATAGPDEAVEQIVGRADAAMYEAKRASRRDESTARQISRPSRPRTS